MSADYIELRRNGFVVERAYVEYVPKYRFNSLVQEGDTFVSATTTQPISGGVIEFSRVGATPNRGEG